MSELTLNEEYALRGYQTVVPVRGRHRRLVTRNGRIVASRTASQGWEWIARWDRKVASLRGACR